jgi:hypothetical protein
MVRDICVTIIILAGMFVFIFILDRFGGDHR